MSVQSTEELSDEIFNITKLPHKLFFAHRMLIMQLLLKYKELRFHQLRNLLRTTDGNLASHLRALENEGFIMYRKSDDRATRTYYRITDKGLEIFNQLKHQLRTTLEF